ncbi:MAG: hypothetical protein WKF36_09985 [Candidatus Nitrosocosmicus sp.]
MFQFINIKGIVIPAIIVTFAFSLGAISVINAFSQETAFAATDLDIPSISLEYNGGKLDLNPIINVKDKLLTKINSPESEPDVDSIVYSINNGDKISFNLGEKPARVDAYLVDYEAEYNTLYALEKSGDQEFIAKAPSPGIYNAEVHALYPDGRYTSYAKLVKIEDDKMDLLSLTPDKTNCQDELKSSKVTAIGNPTNLLSDITSQVSTGIGNPTNLLSDIASQPIVKEFALGKTDELIIELANNDDVCGLQMGLANSETDINFFAVQFSQDGNHYEYPIVFSNTGHGNAPELYRYPSSIEAKYLKVVSLGSAVIEGLGMEDLKIVGN